MEGMTNRFKLISIFTLAFVLSLSMSIQTACGEESKPSKEEAADDDSHLRGGIIYGKDHAYCLSAPNLWVLDNQAGVDQGLHAVFYPEGGSWSDSKAVMYSRIIDKGGNSLEEIIKDDLDHMKEGAPNFKALDQESIKCTQGAKAQIKFLSGDKFKSFEAIAYIEEPKKVVIIVLTARDEANFKSSVEPFKQLVKSYFWMTDNVKIEK